jgi:hypothetical protein
MAGECGSNVSVPTPLGTEGVKRGIPIAVIQGKSVTIFVEPIARPAAPPREPEPRLQPAETAAEPPPAGARNPSATDDHRPEQLIRQGAA